MDLNRNAFRIVQALTQENGKGPRTAAGRIGGKRGGLARAAALSPERRRAIAKKANNARWAKKSLNTVPGKN